MKYAIVIFAVIVLILIVIRIDQIENKIDNMQNNLSDVACNSGICVYKFEDRNSICMTTIVTRENHVVQSECFIKY
jgi:hypothetical protein